MDSPLPDISSLGRALIVGGEVAGGLSRRAVVLSWRTATLPLRVAKGTVSLVVTALRNGDREEPAQWAAPAGDGDAPPQRWPERTADTATEHEWAPSAPTGETTGGGDAAASEDRTSGPVGSSEQGASNVGSPDSSQVAEGSTSPVGGLAADSPTGQPGDTGPTAGDDAMAAAAAAMASVREAATADDPLGAGAQLAHGDLPLPDFDHMTVGSLRGRLRRLDPEDLELLRDYERAHAHRLPVLTLLENRIAKVAAQSGQTSAGGSPAASAAEELRPAEDAAAEVDATVRI